MHRPSAISAVLALALSPSTAQLAGTSSATDLIIAHDGVSEAAIVVSAAAGRWEKQAGADLAKYIAKMSGAAARIVDRPAEVSTALKAATPVFVIGQEALQAEPAVQATLTAVAKQNPLVRADAVVVRRAGTRVFVAGTNDESHYFAAAWLLHQWGCRWYLPGDFGESIPAHRDLKIGTLGHVYAPPFEVRHYWLKLECVRRRGGGFSAAEFHEQQPAPRDGTLDSA